MADNPNNQDPKSPQTSPLEKDEFWDIDSAAEDSDIDALDLDEINAELNKEINITPLEKSITNLSESELQLEEIDNTEIISSLDTAQQRAEADSDHELTDEELDSFREEDVPVLEVVNYDKSSTIEKIMMTLCFLALIGLGAYFIAYLNDKFEVRSEKEWASNIPAKGKYASIDKVETWWTVPQSKNTQFGVKLVPSVTITLGSDSTSGTLRAVFYSYEKGIKGKPRAKGDPFPLPFADGKFVATGTNTITLYGTDGYSDISSFEYYRTQNDDRWTISIREAATGETTAEKFVELGHAPIEPTRRGTEEKTASSGSKTASE